MKRRDFYLAAACLVAGGVAFWVLAINSTRRHFAFCQEARAEFESLAKRRPPGVSREQWQSVVAWTLNGHCNILEFRQEIPQRARDKFLLGLRGKLGKPVDLSTIDWIWDQFEILSPSYGPIYSANYRPTSPKRLHEFEEPGSPWRCSWGIEVD